MIDFQAKKAEGVYSRVWVIFFCFYLHYIHTYHSRFIPEGVAEASQTFLRDAHVLPILFSYE
jgi:hypothetical protein